MQSLSGKVVVVSGASGFLGQEIITALRDAGAVVVAVYRTALLDREGVHAYQCDLMDYDSVENLFATIEKDVGKIGVCIHAAATKGSRKKLYQEDVDAFQ